MTSMNELVREYTLQLSKNMIQKAYRGIMSFMADLRSDLEGKYPDFTATGLYFGYMDMTYFAFTPLTLKEMKLKVAIVYLHEENRFEVWLGGNNRQIQSQFIELLSQKDLGRHELSIVQPGVDSIIASQLIHQPDFDNPAGLKQQIEAKTLGFINYIILLLRE